MKVGDKLIRVRAVACSNAEKYIGHEYEVSRSSSNRSPYKTMYLLRNLTRNGDAGYYSKEEILEYFEPVERTLKTGDKVLVKDRITDEGLPQIFMVDLGPDFTYRYGAIHASSLNHEEDMTHNIAFYKYCTLPDVEEIEIDGNKLKLTPENISKLKEAINE